MKMNCKETKKRWTAQETEYIQQILVNSLLKQWLRILTEVQCPSDSMYYGSESLQKQLSREIY